MENGRAGTGPGRAGPGRARPGRAGPGRAGPGQNRFLVAQTLEFANLEQNLMHELMATSVRPCVVRNLAKFAKKNFSIRKFREKNFFGVEK